MDETEICSQCAGSGYGGHPDSGALCSMCKGSGGVDGRGRLISDLRKALHEARDELYQIAHSSCDPDSPASMDSTACAYRACRDALSNSERTDG